jgi:hypothetical protein
VCFLRLSLSKAPTDSSSARILDVVAIGDHVGDWEHVMVRFYNGEPQYLFMSTHSNGMAYNYSSLMTSEGNRATVWIAEGKSNYRFTNWSRR